MVRAMLGLLRDVGSGGGQHRRTPAARARARDIPDRLGGRQGRREDLRAPG